MSGQKILAFVMFIIEILTKIVYRAAWYLFLMSVVAFALFAGFIILILQVVT